MTWLQSPVFIRVDWGRINSYLVRRLNQLSRCSRAKVELNTIEFDTTIARRLNRGLEIGSSPNNCTAGALYINMCRFTIRQSGHSWIRKWLWYTGKPINEVKAIKLPSCFVSERLKIWNTTNTTGWWWSPRCPQKQIKVRTFTVNHQTHENWYIIRH